MATPDWQLTSDERRLVGLLLWLVEQDKGNSATRVAPFYEGDPSQARQARDDVRDLQARDWARAQIAGGMTLGGISAMVTPTGRSAAGAIRQDQQNQTARRVACRSALVAWLYEQDAMELPSSGVDWIEITESKHAHFYGDPFTTTEVERAAAWLHRQGLVDGPTIAEAEAPMLAHLTDLGVQCAEEYGADVIAFKEAKEMQQPRGHTFNVNGQNVQLATGDRSQQVMNFGQTAEDIATALRGLVDLVRALDLADETDDLDVLTVEAVQDITSPSPTGTPARRLLDRVRGLAAAGANAGVTTAVTLAVNAASKDVGDLVSAMAGAAG